MKKLFGILILLTSSLVLANPIKEQNLSPSTKPAQVPGTEVPLENMNTAPTPLPSENESDTFRGVLSNKDKSKKQEAKKTKKPLK